MASLAQVNGSMRSLLLALVLVSLRLDAAESYAWDNAQLHGMGFVTGVVVHPTADRIYLRTDVGGVYLRDEAAGRWWNITDKNRSIENDIESIAVIPSVADGVAFASGNTVWRSLDAGTSWVDTGLSVEMRGNGDRRRGGERLAVDPLRADRMWYGSRMAGLWKWNGSAWSAVPAVPIGGQDSDPTHVPAWPSLCYGVCWVAVDPTGGNATTGSQIIYAGVEGSGIWRTLNGGTTWAMIPGSPGNGDGFHPIRGQVVAGKLITTWTAGGILDANASGGGAWRWDGSAWTQLMSNTRRCAIAATTDGSELVLGGFDTTPTFLSRSLNGGTFTTITLSSPSVPGWWPSFYPYGWGAGAAFDPRRPGELWYTDGFGPYRIRNLGTAQQTVTAEMHGVEELVLQMLSADPQGGIVAGCADVYGLKVIDPEVVPSIAIVPGQFGITTGVDRCSARPDTVVIVGSDENNGTPVHRVSHDGGSAWATFSNPNPAKSYAGVWDGVVAVASGNPLNWVWYPNTASWAENGKGSIGSYVTRNGGATWTATSGMPGFISDVGNHWNVARLVVADGARDGVFYCIAGNIGLAQSPWSRTDFFRSTDAGATWTKIAYSGSLYVWSYQMSIHPVPGVADELWVTCGGQGDGVDFARSQDGGNTWVNVAGITSARRMAFGAPAAGRTNPAMFAYAAVGGVDGLWRSDDVTSLPGSAAGATWTRIDTTQTPLPGVQDMVGDLREPGAVWFGTSGRGLIFGRPSNVAPRIVTQPVTASARVGGAASLTVEAAGGPTLSYQWQRWSGSAWGAVGSNAAALTLSGLASGDDGARFRVLVSSAGGTTTSEEAAIRVLVASNAGPSVASAASASVAGQAVALAVLGTDDAGEADLTYTWASSVTGTLFSGNGSNAAKAVIAWVPVAGSCTFTVTIRDGSNATTTSQVVATVAAPAVPTGYLRATASSVTAVEGTTATITVQRLGGSSGALVLAWATTPGSAGAGDYTSAAGILTWASGDSAAKTLSFNALNDGVSEGSERCRIVLVSPAMPAGSQVGLLISNGAGNQPPTISGVSGSPSVLVLP
ncbi:MAG TPA: hypothetical protein DCS97_16735 [Planctomycetes bacterium]|nr:hypothetical protein [Planctomycetota bacterium]